MNRKAFGVLGSKPTITGSTGSKAGTKLKEDINSDKTPKKKAGGIAGGTGGTTTTKKTGDGAGLLKPPVNGSLLNATEKKSSGNSLNSNGDFSKRHSVLVTSSGGINGSSN